MNFYARHIGDYLKDTAHLSLLEHGIYARLLDVYYTRESAIPENEVCRLIGARSKDEREALKNVLSEFFSLQNDAWSQIRCEQEIEKYKAKQDSARQSANARWKPTSDASERNAKSMRTHSERNAKAMLPITNNQEDINTSAKVSPPDGVSIKVWADFCKLRKQLKAPITDTAMAGITREANAAGITLELALQTMIERSWRGFKAEWVKNDTPAQQSGSILAGAI